MASATNPLPQLIPQRVGKAKQRVDDLVWDGWRDLRVEGGPINATPLPLAQGRRQAFRPVRAGEHFGPAHGGWQQRWFRVAVPAAAADERGRRYLHWECHGEATAWLDGEPLAGLDLAHRTCLLPDRACTLFIDCGTYATAIWAPGHQPVGRYGARFDWARTGRRSPLAWKVCHDLDVLVQMMNLQLKDAGFQGASGFGHQPALQRCSPLTRLLLRGLDDACDAFDRDGLGALGDALDALFRRLPAESWQPVAAIVPQSHIDLVWLWPESETARKGVHSFATMLRLMEAYPEVTFSCSQPALYRAIERLAPGQYRAVRRRIAEGRWEATGGFETEPDTQLPCGEALARSLVIGQRTLADLRGGSISSLCWLPDVFGYAACLPQILRLGGIEHFYTTKMTWSAITRFPYNSFVWRGADGSEVLAHLCTTGYTGVCEVENLVNAVRDFRQADVHPELLVAQGLGDGGGGPTEAMIERARRLADLAGSPRARWSQGEPFFRRMERVRDRLPVYQGELYLEYHRGTFTTQSEQKRLYRAAECALQAHEAVRVATRGTAAPGAGLPLDEGPWRRVAFAQFHDALPGSSIGLVYQQLNPELEALATEELAAAGKELMATGHLPGTLAFNPLPVPRRALVALPAAGLSGLRSAEGLDLPVQRVGRGRGAQLLTVADCPALGGVRLLGVAADEDRADRQHASAGSDAGLETLREVSATTLDNGLLRARFDRRGQLVGLAIDGEALDLAGGAGLRLHADHPANFDAWDIDHCAARLGQAAADRLELRVVERGPLRAILRGTADLGARSSLAIDYILVAGSRHLRIEVAVDWREDHRMLKYHVPTGYRGRWARFGMPFGSIQRPQLPGTQEDEAMWEVPGSRWAAVTDEHGAGLAVLTEAKYGFSCRDGDLGLTLLRSPKHPDGEADMGRHRLRFALGRHRAHSVDGALGTAAAADALFAPLLAVDGGSLGPPPFVLGALGSLAPSWVLPSADGAGWILRLHETNGERGSAMLDLAAIPRSVTSVDFLERRLGRPRRIAPRRYALDYAPYQVLSVLVR